MEIQKMAKLIQKSGGTLYLVGGAVRDSFLERKIIDEDYCVVGLSKQEFQKLFPEAKARGDCFEVFELGHKEFAMARREKKIEQGHKGFKINTGKEITIQQDLARRDITINAIAQNVITGEIIDPYHGIRDVENKIIRATTQAFSEDPLRVYRVARLASQLNFSVEKNTILLMKQLKAELNSLPKERVFTEFKKALQSNYPIHFFNILKEAQVLEVHFKEIYDLIGALQPIQYHPEGDAYNHTMEALQRSVSLTKKAEIRFSVLVHDLGKGRTPKQEYPHHYGHDKRGVKLVEDLAKRIGLPNLWIKSGKISAEQHMRAGIFETMTAKKQVELLERLHKSALGLKGMEIVVQSDAKKGIPFEKIGNKMMKEINGEYIMKKYDLKQGVQLKEKLQYERIEWLRTQV